MLVERVDDFHAVNHLAERCVPAVLRPTRPLFMVACQKERLCGPAIFFAAVVVEYEHAAADRHPYTVVENACFPPCLKLVSWQW
jgi:hypothetical protein